MAEPGQFRLSLRSRILDHMIREVKSTSNSQWMVLVVDREALRILAAAIELSELIEEGITIVQILHLRREPLNLPAIYFITPESISQFIAEDKKQYRQFNLFFTTRLTDSQTNVLKDTKGLVRRLRRLVELNIPFLGHESRLFSLDRPAASLPDLYGNEGNTNHPDAVKEMSLVSEHLSDACEMLASNVEWTIRSDGSSFVSKTISSLVKEQLETLRIERVRKSPDLPSIFEETPPNAPKKATLLVLDRATDVVTPLLHDFSYQSIVHDLVQLDNRQPDGAHYECSELDGRSLPIDDEDGDPIWSSIRHIFIEEARNRAAEGMEEFIESNPAFRITQAQAKDVDVEDMRAAIRSIPEAKKHRDRYVMHLSAIKDCLKHIEDLELAALATVEQDIAIGANEQARRLPPKAIIDSLKQILENESIPVHHRLRLFLIALAEANEDKNWMGGEASILEKSSTFKQAMKEDSITNAMSLGRTQSASVKGLQKLLSMKKAPAAKREKMMTRRKQRLEEDSDSGPLHVARYLPPLRGIVAKLLDDDLDAEEFPKTGIIDIDRIIQNKRTYQPVPQDEPTNMFCNCLPMNNVVNTRAFDFGQELDMIPTSADPDHLYLIFIVGGVSYQEVRTIYEICAKSGANLIIGGTKMLTPKMFLDGLGGIADSSIKRRVTQPPVPIDLRSIWEQTKKIWQETKTAVHEKQETISVPSSFFNLSFGAS